MMKEFTSVALAATFALLAGTAVPATAQNKCQSAKIKAAAKDAKCLFGLEIKAAKSGVPADPLRRQECAEKFTAGFAKAEAKGGCSTTSDVAAIGAKVAAAVDDIAAALAVAIPNKCQSAKLKAAAKKTKCLLGLEAKGAKSGLATEPDKAQQCVDKFDAGFAKAEAKGGCSTTNDVAGIEARIDAAVDDIASELGSGANTGPLANAGVDQVVPIGTTVTLDGSQSSDPDNDPLSFAWEIVSAPAGSLATLSDPALVGPTFVADSEGTYVCKLVVDDGAEASAPDTVTIRSLADLPPTADAGPDQTRQVGETATLDGTGSYDPNGEPLTFQWTLVSAPGGSAAALLNSTSPNPSMLIDLPGEYVVELIVHDGGQASGPDFVIVSTSNAAPVADAGADRSSSLGETVTLDGSGSSDVDGDPLTFAWMLLSAPPGSTATLSDTAAVQPSIVIDQPGRYVVRLVVDDGTATSAPDEVVITTGNSAPVANAGVDQAAVVGQTVVLDGSGSTDVDGNSLTYAWSLVTAPPGASITLSDATAVSTEFTLDVAGDYVFQLIVNDGFLDGVPDTVVVSTGGLPPMADAGPGQTVTVGANVSLDGSESSDPNGDPLTFNWSFVVKPAGSTATFSDPAAVDPTFVADVAGVYVAQLVVSDGIHISAPDSVTISTERSRPIARAGSDQVVLSGSTVTLDGTASVDPDGQPLTFEWVLLTRPAGSSATLSNPSAAQPAFVADLEGAYVVQLVVHDGTDLSLPDTLLVTTSDEFISLTIDLATLLTFSTAEGRVELSKPAGVGGVRVFLASQVPNVANVPTSVTIPAEQTTATFVITSFETSGSALITAFTRGFVDGEATVAVFDRQTTLTLAAGLVGVGQTLKGMVSLQDPAPAGGAALVLSSTAAAIATIDPPVVLIPAGDTTANVTVSGLVPGSATFVAAAEGYVTSQASVTVTTDFVSVPLDVVLAPGQTLPFPVSLSTAAPAGGTTITLTSNDPGRVSIAPAAVTVPAGQTMPTTQPQVTGGALGVADVTASAPGYAPGIEDVEVKLGLTISPSSLTVVAGNTLTVTLSLSAQAPSGGAVVNLTLDDPSLATATTPVLFPASVAVQQATITGVSVGTTTLRGSGIGIDTASASLTVEPPPAINLSATALTIGKNLMHMVSGTLEEPAPAGNLNVTITSLDPSRLLLSPNGTTAETASIVLQVPAGSASIPSFFVASLGDSGTAQIEATASGYATGTISVTSVPSGFVVGASNSATLFETFETTVLSSPTTLEVWAMPLDAATLTATNWFAARQPVRPGAAPVSVSMTSSNPAVGVMTTSPVLFGANHQAAATTFDPQAPGTAVVSIATPPGWSTPSNLQAVTATVDAPEIFLSDVTVGRDLQEQWSLSLEAPAPPGNLTVTLTSGDPSRVVLSTDPTAAGSGTLTLTILAGNTSSSTFYAQALADNGTTTVTAGAPGYTADTGTVTLVPSGFVVGSSNFFVLFDTFETTTLAAATPVEVWAMPLDAATLSASNWFAARQPVRPGAAPVSVSVTSSDPGVGLVTTSPVVFGANQEVGSTTFDPQTSGTAVISIGTPAGWSAPSNLQAVTATVEAPEIFLGDLTVGHDLQEAWSLSLEAPAPAGNLAVTLTSGDPSRLVLSTDPTVAGSGTLTLTIPAGSSSSATFYAQALAGSGTVTVTATAPAYTADTSTVTLVPSGFIVGVSNSAWLSDTFATTTLSAPTPVEVWAMPLDATTLNATNAWWARQPVRPGAAPVSVSVTSSNPAVGVVTASPVVFAVNQEVGTTTFHPQAAGMAVVGIATPAGWSTPSSLQAVTATVEAPEISLGDVTVGRDLQVQWSFSLEAPAPAGNLTVTLTSGDPSRLVLSTDPAVAGSGTLSLSIPAGSSGSPAFYAQALSGSGTVTVTATAPGYTADTGTATLVPSGFVAGLSNSAWLTETFATTTLSAATTLELWAMPLDPTTLNATNIWWTRQPVRPGAAPVSVSVTSSHPAVGVVTSPVVFGANQEIGTTTFDPQTAGTAVISIGTPAGWSTPSNLQAVTATVEAPDISLGDVTVGRDLQEAWSLSLEVPVPAESLTVTLTSADPARLVLSTDPTVAGSGTLTLAIPAGSSNSAAFYAQALAGSGTVTVTATAPGYTADTGTATLVPSGLVVGLSNSAWLTEAFATTTLSAPTPVEVWAMPLDATTLNATNAWWARQPVRPGAAPVSVSVTSSNPAAGVVTTSPVVFGVNQEVGTTAFDPQGAGTAVVSIGTPAGWTTPFNLQSLTATVTAPDISLPTALPIGKDLQEAATFTLEEPAPAEGLTVTLTVADPAKARLKTVPTNPGSGTLVLHLAQGTTTSDTFYVEALSGSGTVSWTATAPGFDSDMEAITLTPSGFVIDNITAATITTSLSDADTTLRIKPARLDPTTLNFHAVQSLRAGLTGTQVAVTSDDPAVGEITLSPLTFDGADVPNERVTSFSPLTVGTTTIRVASPGFSSASNHNNIGANVTP